MVRIEAGTCKGSLHLTTRIDRDLELLNHGDCLVRQKLVTPGNIMAIVFIVTNKIGYSRAFYLGFITLSLKLSCWPAESQRRQGMRVSKSVKHSVDKSVPVISNSCSCVFSHSIALTCSLNNPKQSTPFFKNQILSKIKVKNWNLSVEPENSSFCDSVGIRYEAKNPSL